MPRKWSAKNPEDHINKFVERYLKDRSEESFQELYPHLERVVGWYLKTLPIYMKFGKPKCPGWVKQDGSEKSQAVVYSNSEVALQESRSVGRDDLMQAGLIGCIKALDTYDPAGASGFINWSHMCVRGSLTQCLRPEQKSCLLSRRVKGGYSDSNILQIFPRWAEEAGGEDYWSPNSITPFKKKYTRTMRSERFSEGGVSSKTDELNFSSLRETILNLDRLRPPCPDGPPTKTPPQPYASVLILRYGLWGSPEHTLQQVGDLWGVTRERVRQIEAQALRLLRSILGRKGLSVEDFL